jgi:predicted DNA-binding transcriptional regulator AlpA
VAKRTDNGEAKLTLTIAQFCSLVPMSQAMYFRMKRAGQGPQELRIGRHVRISKQAAEAWVRDQERRSMPHP